MGYALKYGLLLVALVALTSAQRHWQDSDSYEESSEESSEEIYYRTGRIFSPVKAVLADKKDICFGKPYPEFATLAQGCNKNNPCPSKCMLDGLGLFTKLGRFYRRGFTKFSKFNDPRFSKEFKIVVEICANKIEKTFGSGTNDVNQCPATIAFTECLDAQATPEFYQAISYCAVELQPGA